MGYVGRDEESVVGSQESAKISKSRDAAPVGAHVYYSLWSQVEKYLKAIIKIVGEWFQGVRWQKYSANLEYPNKPNRFPQTSKTSLSGVPPKLKVASPPTRLVWTTPIYGFSHSTDRARYSPLYGVYFSASWHMP